MAIRKNQHTVFIIHEIGIRNIVCMSRRSKPPKLQIPHFTNLISHSTLTQENLVIA